MRSALVVGLTILAACAAGTGTGGGASLTTARREEQVVVRAHNEITQVSAGERLVFAASMRGVIIYDALFGRWLPSMEMDDAFRRPLTVLAADPTEDAVWVGAPGRVIYYRPRIDYAITVTVSGTPQEIFFDHRNLSAGAYVLVGSSTLRVTRTGNVVPGGAVPGLRDRAYPSTARDVFRQYPSLETFLPLLTRDANLEQWQASAATVAPGRSEVWLGTRGNGLYRVDPALNRGEHLPFGLLEAGVGAMAVAADGIWVAGLGSPVARAGLVFASDDLQRWRWITGPPSLPLVAARVNALAIRNREAWIATTRGLERLSLDEEGRLTQWDIGDGLPSDVVSSVVPRADGAWVGTTAGLALVERSARPVGPRVGVHDMLILRDTLWIASEVGLLALAAPDSAPRRLTIADARLARRIVALARVDTVLVLATDDELVELELVSRRILPPRAANVAAVRRIGRVTMDAQTIWIAGEGGALAIHRATGRSALLPVGMGLPAAATSVALARDVAWIGTRDGLVRIRRRADGMPP